MERSLAGRTPLIRSPLRGLPRVHVPAPLAGAAAAPARLLARVWHRRSGRIALLLAVLALPLLAGAWMWLRNSSLVAVRQVRISGVRGPEARAIESALTGAARGMTTLHVRPGALRAAVAAFPVVREVRASASFPHGIHIAVVEQLPVAALVAGGTRTAVAADGVALGPALLSAGLPTVAALVAPPPGHSVAGAIQRSAVTVLGAAPSVLAKRVARVYSGPHGLTVAMRNGLLAYFGDDTLPHAKWLALARVLADPSAAGAAYVDVQLPSRPAAGFPEGVAPSLPAAASSQAGGEQSSPGESVAALAAGLAAGAGVGGEASGKSGEAGASGASESSSESSSEGAGERSEGSSEHASEASAGHGEEAESAHTPGG